MIKIKGGNLDEAQAYFSNALSIMPTEIQALFGRLSFHLSSGDISEALPLANMIARRWPEHWPKIEPYLPNLLATPDAVAAASKALADNPASRTRIIRSLIKSPDTLPYAIALLEQWKSDPIPLAELRPLSVSISNALFAAKDYTQAYFLFRSMLDDEQQKVAGYIFNSQFTQPSSNNMFDWRLKAQQGASMTMRSDGLEIRFRDSPLQFSGLQQFFRVPPGKFVLRTNYTTKDVVAPKSLRFVVTCVGSRTRIADLELKAGTLENAEAAAKFDVPASDCPALGIALLNDFAAQSWSNRYRGSMTLHSVTVERDGVDGS